MEELERQQHPPASIFSQIAGLQDSLSSQLLHLSGSLPDAGPLSAEFRQRAIYAMYLLIASIAFGILAIVIGLPTLILRPSKFVICMTLSSLLGASSVVVMQKPSVFFSNLMNSGAASAGPVVALGISMLFTLYVAVFIHSYVSVIFAGAVQILCLLYYLSSFVPGGSRGLTVLLQTTWLLVRTTMTPVIYVAKKSCIALLARIFAD